MEKSTDIAESVPAWYSHFLPQDYSPWHCVHIILHYCTTPHRGLANSYYIHRICIIAFPNLIMTLDDNFETKKGCAVIFGQKHTSLVSMARQLIRPWLQQLPAFLLWGVHPQQHWSWRPLPHLCKCRWHSGLHQGDQGLLLVGGERVNSHSRGRQAYKSYMPPHPSLPG